MAAPSGELATAALLLAAMTHLPCAGGECIQTFTQLTGYWKLTGSSGPGICVPALALPSTAQLAVASADPCFPHQHHCRLAACRLFVLQQLGQMKLDPKGGWKETTATQASAMPCS